MLEKLWCFYCYYFLPNYELNLVTVPIRESEEQWKNFKK
jgi:hypothetical protein